MQYNWYEAAVSANAPHRIISVVDWASDSPTTLPPSSSKPATYNVFAWGTNDPSEGNRSITTENFDVLASPVGWHALPYANDPSFHGVRLNTTEFYRNTTTTWGNNVCDFCCAREITFYTCDVSIILGLCPGELEGLVFVY
jgi:extracellular elastinolytic metalloproteinase